MGNFSGDAKAPFPSLLLHVLRSCSHSAAVGIRNPEGHGLFSAEVPDHICVSTGLNQL